MCKKTNNNQVQNIFCTWQIGALKKSLEIRKFPTLERVKISQSVPRNHLSDSRGRKGEKERRVSTHASISDLGRQKKCEKAEKSEIYALLSSKKSARRFLWTTYATREVASEKGASGKHPRFDFRPRLTEKVRKSRKLRNLHTFELKKICPKVPTNHLCNAWGCECEKGGRISKLSVGRRQNFCPTYLPSSLMLRME